MQSRVLHRAAALGVGGSLLVAGLAFADSVTADTDTLTPGSQGSIDLGMVAPGSNLTVPVSLILTCGGTSHLDAGQVVVLASFTAGAPVGGAIMTTGTTISPPAGWPADGSVCANPPQIASTATPAMVTLTAPTAVGGPYAYDALFRATSTGNLAGIGSFVGVSFTLSVGVNTPPELIPPGDLAVVTDDPTGAFVDFSVTATDAEDDPDPAADCTPAAGSWFPIGTTTVRCSATDLGGLTATASFAVTLRYEAPVVVWFETPVRANGPTPAPANRTLPLKVHLVRGGEPVRGANVDVVVAACDGSSRAGPAIPMTPTGPRWMANVALRSTPGCLRVDVRLDGDVVGGFYVTAVVPSADRSAAAQH